VNPIPQEATRPKTDLISRSNKMSLMNEDLARAHSRQLRDDAEAHRLAHRLIVARRLERRAARAARRARRLAAAAVAASARV
jgi:hypothetical protein